MHTLVLNEYVFKRRRRNTNLCSFCDVQVETVTHFFWECIIVQNFWNQVVNMLNDVCHVKAEDAQLNAANVIFNEATTSWSNNIANFIVLIAKYYLYRTRCKSELPNSKKLYCEIIYLRNIEKYNVTVSNKLHVHYKKMV